MWASYSLVITLDCQFRNFGSNPNAHTKVLDKGNNMEYNTNIALLYTDQQRQAMLAIALLEIRRIIELLDETFPDLVNEGDGIA